LAVVWADDDDDGFVISSVFLNGGDFCFGEWKIVFGAAGNVRVCLVVPFGLLGNVRRLSVDCLLQRHLPPSQVCLLSRWSLCYVMLHTLRYAPIAKLVAVCLL
jgi:hypothetical protein